MWILLALISAIGIGFENVWQKKSTLHFNAFLITWSLLVVSAIVYLPLLIRSGIPPHLGSMFWPAVIARIVVDSAALILSIRALHLAHISLAVPMMSFQPIFVIIMSLLLNHLFPSVGGIIGTIIIVAGVYFLNFDHDTKHILSPFTSIIRERGSSSCWQRHFCQA